MAPKPVLLVGVDVGTTRVKAGLIDQNGQELARAAVSTVWQATATGAQTTAQAFVDSVYAALSEVMAIAPAGAIAALGVTSMAETAIQLDGNGQVVGPSIAWYDEAARADFDEFLTVFPPDVYGRITGLGTGTIPTVPVLRRLRRELPAVQAAAHSLSVAEWLVFALGGELAAEASLASRTGALNVQTRAWSSEILDWAGLPTTLFGPVRLAGSSWGQLRNAPAGLERLNGVTLTVAGVDHLAAAVGVGVTEPNQVLDSCGTAEALVRALPSSHDHRPEAGLRFDIATGIHVLPDCYALISALNLGLELRPVLDRLGIGSRGGCTELDPGALEILHDSGDQPVAGDGSASPAGRWLDALRARVEPWHRALSDINALGTPITACRLSGGWAANPVLLELKQRDYPIQFSRSKVVEAGVRGAALLAGKAAGVFTDHREFPPAPIYELNGHELQTNITKERDTL